MWPNGFTLFEYNFFEFVESVDEVGIEEMFGQLWGLDLRIYETFK